MRLGACVVSVCVRVLVCSSCAGPVRAIAPTALYYQTRNPPNNQTFGVFAQQKANPAQISA